MYHDASQADILAIQNNGEPIGSIEAKEAFYFCLGWNDKATAQGRPFTAAQIPGNVDDAFRVEIVQKLVAKGLLVPVSGEAESEEERRSTQGKAASYFGPEL